MLRLVVRNSQGHIEATSDKPFEARTADIIRNELGQMVGNKCRTEFLQRLVSDTRALVKNKVSDITVEFKWRYTDKENCFTLTISIIIKGKTWLTAIYSAQAEEERAQANPEI